MSDKRKVILDCDTGSDDAVAIMMAILSPKIDLLGVTTVAGNKEINFTTDNTLRVVDMLRSDTPVYRGCATSMVAKLLPNRHGSYTGMTGVKEDKLDDKGGHLLPPRLPAYARPHQQGAAGTWGLVAHRHPDEVGGGHHPHPHRAADQYRHGPAAGAPHRREDQGDHLHGGRLQGL